MLTPRLQRAIATEVPAMGRSMRRPAHTFQVRHQPYVLQPFMIAPVLPGETLKNALLQARVVSDPIKNPLIGWWLEYYIFYVKHRDLNDREAFQNMVLDPAWVKTPYVDTDGDVQTYTYAGAIDWTRKCLERVTEEYFRNDGELHSERIIDTLPIASINNQSLWDSLIASSAFAVPSVEVEGSDANTTIQASEIDAAMRQYQFLMQNELTTQTYEEFLGTYGVKPQREETHRPELVRFIRQWSYPSNTVDPATGTPSSALSWSIAERADKDRFLREPGFIFGVTCARPKVYLSNQQGSGVGMLDNAYSWLPAMLNDDWRSSYKEFTDAIGGGPLGDTSTAGNYWVDLKDLFIYGDQYVNFARTATDAGMVALPGSGLKKRYVLQADIDALFKTPLTLKHIRQDGICTLQIASRLQHTSPET